MLATRMATNSRSSSSKQSPAGGRGGHHTRSPDEDITPRSPDCRSRKGSVTVDIMTDHPTIVQRRPRTSAVLAFAVLAVAALAVGAYIVTRQTTIDSTPTGPGVGLGAASATPAAPTTAARVRVADLMARAGCNGQVIGTQLYSYETGRCDVVGTSVTIAVFDTDQLRDQWVEAGRQFGGTFVVGTGWAAGLENPDAAAGVASKLQGRVL